ncbi:alpha-amylase family glycosyl hydrolase [Spirochaeta cellobiosiphila]|uniref:alpha-amylase family glycosyl hydrolase n=1 Tax=Spirochaeta cellobiosiphila TaxID=504483 RepID=UPI00040C5840|nr:alpha-amylase family glycosyl hydrolase [Spirochaeta cellobiosiphila]
MHHFNRQIIVTRSQSQQGRSMEFHISKETRDKYQFDNELFTTNGNVIITNLNGARQLAFKLNENKDLLTNPEEEIKAAQIFTMGLIDEILHYVCHLYRTEKGADTFDNVIPHLVQALGQEELNKVLYEFTNLFPPKAVYQNTQTSEEYLSTSTDTIDNNIISIEEIMLLWLANQNQAFKPYKELFDDSKLIENTKYTLLMGQLDIYFKGQDFFGPENLDLLGLLQSPSKHHPTSLRKQLEYIKNNWGHWLSEYLLRLLNALDYMNEEDKFFLRPTSFNPQPSIPSYSGLSEREGFTEDKSWMPNAIVLAKNTLVWLEQLSKKYQKDIHTLDKIPDEELINLSNFGFTAIWFIGLWERSKASQTIKQINGNLEATGSAYSVAHYDIAQNLGGWEALYNLKKRASHYGLKIASDMVPNHTGIDANLLYDHPDWFIHCEYSPFPNYSFNGINLSQSSNVGIFLEDHYYDHTDASVVFKHIEYSNNKIRYIYHGNDGTFMPWNDTAQLNYLLPEVREYVIDQIIKIANIFPIIRFDAAMTLTKKHIQRLWFPEPGTGGAIPSRAEHSLNKHDFDQLIPEEFWREVVDRVQKEVPDTLLIAEAFWMMEGYFVRSLGLHRVYNSAFMHMLRDEKNGEFRTLIKNTLLFDADILKRFVNFMNNPDEETAIEQFGDGDKYFGVCTLLVTLPGTPMFGHGQIEGFKEKYGMEYVRPLWDENPNLSLLNRHQNEISPLMKKRYLFSGVKNFYLYDLWSTEGFVNENVIIFSNKLNNENVLVLYNNCHQNAQGWINQTVGYKDKYQSDDHIKQRKLGEVLNLSLAQDRYVIFREYFSNLWYIRSCYDFSSEGLFISLNGYGKHIFTDFYEIQDDHNRHYNSLCYYLNGHGVSNIQKALGAMVIAPIGSAILNFMTEGYNVINRENNFEERLNEITGLYSTFVNDLNKHFHQNLNYKCDITGLVKILEFEKIFKASKSRKVNTIIDFINKETVISIWIVFAAKTLLDNIMTNVIEKPEYLYIKDLILEAIIEEYFLPYCNTHNIKIDNLSYLLRVLTQERICFIHKNESTNSYKVLTRLFRDTDCRQLFGVNQFDGILWYNKEKFINTSMWLTINSLITNINNMPIDKNVYKKIIDHSIKIIEPWINNSDLSEFRVKKLLRLVMECSDQKSAQVN